MNKEYVQKIIINKYFMIVALLVSIFSLVDYGNLKEVPQESVQLSSQATDKDSSSADQEVFYDLQLELLKNTSAILDNKKVYLKKGDVISLRVPRSALGESLDISKINLNDVVKKANPISKSNIEVTILKYRHKDLVGETVNLNPNSLPRRGALKITTIETANDDDSDDETLDDEKPSEGSVCTSCLGLDNPERIDSKNLFTNIYQKILGHSEKKITSMDEAVKSYENSQTVKDLMSILKRGYTAENYRAKRRTRVKLGVGSRSIGACYNGVKTALLKAGMTDSNRLLKNRAKEAGPQLEKYGFIDLLKTDYKSKIKSLYDCPKGAVVVYSGGRSGHIEICTGDGYMSDYYSPTPRTGGAFSGRGRVVTGIYIKSNTEINNYLASNEMNKEGGAR